MAWQRVAMRKYTETTSTVYFLLSDHLGSTSIVTDESGTLVSELRYSAYGEERYSSGNTPTDYCYTGQLSKMAEIGLYFYNARWMDPAISHFIQADTYVPESQGGQAWNRYAFVNNNPVNYTDPSGHCIQAVYGVCIINDAGTVSDEAQANSSKQVTLPSLTEKIKQGDTSALIQLLIPSHIGGRLQLEISLDIGIGLSGSVGVNGVYNRNSDELAANIDWALEPGIGIGAGVSGTGGLLIGWGSSSVSDATQGYSGIISGTAAAEVAVAAAVTAPLDEKGLHVDPYSGQVPPTIYIGGGAGGGYAGIGGGINGPTGIYVNLTPFLPWHWYK